MQSSTLLLALSTLTTGALLPRAPAQPVSETISITSFSISSIEASGTASYSFAASAANGGQQGTCSYSENAAGSDGRCPDAPPITGFAAPVKCSADYFSWSLTPQDAPTLGGTPGFSLMINHTLPDGVILTGCRFVGGEEFECQDEGEGERYVGQSAFNVTAQSGSNRCLYA